MLPFGPGIASHPRVGAQHGPDDASPGELEQTTASLGMHELYLLLGWLQTDCCTGERRDMAVATSLFLAQLFISFKQGCYSHVG